MKQGWEGSGRGASCAALAGQVLTDGVASASTALAQAASAAPTGVGGGQLREGLAGLARVHQLADAVLIGLIAEAIDRGETETSRHGLVDWVLLACPGLSRSHAVDLARIATAAASSADRDAHEAIIAAVRTGQLPVRRASMILRALSRIRPVVDDQTYQADVKLLLDAAARAVFTERDLSRITDRLIAVAVPERDHDAREASARALRGMCESSLADGSLTRFVVTAEAEGAALLRSVLNSPLAAPAPEADGTADQRSPAQRRYDALITMLGRGVASPEGQPSTAKAQVMVTMAYDVLQAALARVGEGGALGGPDGFGPGFTSTGETLSAQAMRRLTCQADLIPAVLGGRGELLDLGRAHRLVTAGQRRALAHRDQHCSYPGCTIPATWCEAHHIVHWAHGGRSDLSNYALLCPRHHTHVHDLGLTATLDPHARPGTALTWHSPVQAMPPEPHRAPPGAPHRAPPEASRQ